MKKIIKYILERTYRPLLITYLSKRRIYKYKGLIISVNPGVFHPGFFFSTGLLIKFLTDKEVSGKKLLELGAGTGLISLEMARRGAIVSASDISEVAVENVKENAVRNNLSLQTVHSDLFDELKGSIFDIIIINPPYYPAHRLKESDYAWYCGNDFEYFKKMFLQLKEHIHEKSEIYMILSEDCKIKEIETIAGSAGFELAEVHQQKIWWEKNYIFQIIG